MLKKICLTLIVLFFCQGLLHAQSDSAMRVKMGDTIQIREHGFYYNSRRISAVRMGPLLTHFTASGIEYKRHTNRAVIGGIFLVGSVASGLLAIAYKQQSTQFAIGMATCAAVGIPLTINARRHLKRSVSLFNIDVRK